MNKTLVGIVGVLVGGIVLACLGVMAIGALVPDPVAPSAPVSAPATKVPTRVPPTSKPPTRAPTFTCRSLAGHTFKKGLDGCEAWLQGGAMLVNYDDEGFIGFVIDFTTANPEQAGEDMVFIAYEYGVSLDAIEKVSSRLESGQLGMAEGTIDGWYWTVDADVDAMLLGIGFGDLTFDTGYDL